MSTSAAWFFLVTAVGVGMLLGHWLIAWSHGLIDAWHDVTSRRYDR
jgi:hypothetical protein